MLVQINISEQLSGGPDVAEKIEILVRRKFQRITEKLSRIEVNISDVNGPKGGEDIRCAVEIRPNGMDPVSATDEAANPETAAASAADKVLSIYDRLIGRR